MTTTDECASKRNAGNRRRGVTAEQAVARYLRTWWPEACRAVRTGSSAAPDPGDVANIPGLIVSVKDAATERLPLWMAELTDMRSADPAALPVLVVKRRGTADPGAWWAWLFLRDFVGLTGGAVSGVGTAPVRMELDTLTGLLRRAGYAS